VRRLRSRIGSTEKVCQLTGDTDWETGRPTAGRTFSNFGLDATDLGYPVEHAGKLILLFGDSWPPRHPGGTIREVPPDDAVGVVTRREAPTDAGGLYAPYVLNRYTGAASGSGPGRRSTIYWVVSSWNPYEVSVMRTTLQSDAR
jgi:hypothetical protein